MKLPPPLHHLRCSRQGERANRSAAHLVGLLFLCVAVFTTVLLLTLFTQSVQAQSDSQPADQAENGYTYAVQRGDNWYSVSVRTGVSIDDLQAANPQAVRASGWLITGEKLFIPTDKPVATTTYTVQPGESWSIIAKKFGISMGLLKAANPQAVRYDDVLRRNEVLNIPLPEGAVTPEGTPPADTDAAETAPITATTTVTAVTAPAVAATVTVTATVESPTAEPTATETVTPEPTATETATAEPTATETATAEPTATALPTETATPESTPTTAAPAAPAAAQCPSDFADYPTAILTTLNENGGVDALQSFLTACNAAPTTPPVAQDLTGDGNDDLVVIYPNPNITATQPIMDLLILNGGADGYTVGHQARAESEVNLLGALDINSDGKTDVAWLETTCGADICFDTVQLYSWDGQGWRSWTGAKITMANAEPKLEDQMEVGQGLELVLAGGEYGNPAAGLQRRRTEVWGSVEGAPYTLLTQELASSNCLYHTVLDANAAFADGAADDFAQAEAFYTQATSDTSLVACGQRENEVAELQSFSFYRLALIAAYRGQPDVAADLTGAIAAAYPDSVYAGVSQSWLDAYQPSGDMKAACAAVTQLAESNPEASAVLGDFGFANPTFAAADICPVLPIAIPTPTTPAVGSDAATTVVTETATVTATEGVTATAAATTTAALPGADLAPCPTDLAGYVDTLPTVLSGAGQEAEAVEGWLRTCNALDDQRGAFRLIDLNDDGQRDALFLPTIVSDLGVGPEGTQGAVLIYHGADDGSYTLAANPEIYGLPTLLTVEDLDADQKTDVAWSVAGCGASCVSEVQIVAWDGSVYTSTIAPGATIAEGTAAFASIAAGDPGKGKQLVLTGGVSDTEEGGLAVPHTEIWQSIDGQPFQRIRWTYDRTVDGTNCLGLRLVEADVALQAAPVLGYEAAIDLYTKAIDPSLQACSIFGMAANEELPLLQGLASFRLIQAQALAGDFVAAGEVLTSLSQGQPESGYTKAAQQWLDEYEANADAVAACAAVQPIFDEETDLWQITDHFGYNHPALAAEQICYKP